MNAHTYTLHVTGTHCSACKHLIEDMLADNATVQLATVDLRAVTLTVTTIEPQEPSALAETLTTLLAAHGYAVHTEQQEQATTKHEWLVAIPFVALAVVVFVLLDRAGLTNLIGTSEATLGTAFIVGLVASVSTCLAVVGGLVLSVSATYAHEGKGWRPQALFHVGRLAGFFILGGFLGLLGEAMQIGFVGSAVLGALASVVMLVLGIHLLDITKRVRAFTLPKGVSHFFTSAAQKAGAAAPILLGAVTFFLPCGFTQSMQIVSLSSGSFLTAALIMFVFALGTLPVLAALSFGSLDLAKSTYRGTFFKAAGMLVILFALYNLHNTLVVFGVISPIVSL